MLSAIAASALVAATQAIKLEDVYTYSRGPDHYQTGYGQFSVDKNSAELNAKYADFNLNHNYMSDQLAVGDYESKFFRDEQAKSGSFEGFGFTGTQDG